MREIVKMMERKPREVEVMLFTLPPINPKGYIDIDDFIQFCGEAALIEKGDEPPDLHVPDDDYPEGSGVMQICAYGCYLVKRQCRDGIRISVHTDESLNVRFRQKVRTDEA